MADWVLASASFYPAMAYRQIDGSKYVDGGYRNNVPVDVAIQQGATEVLIVDVQGPGVTKNTRNLMLW
ncbi:patatin-like phospholipase family protein [Enterococcus mundtii]|nr:patatin-like phospholipase family protein [Enterococcus mundtii]